MGRSGSAAAAPAGPCGRSTRGSSMRLRKRKRTTSHKAKASSPGKGSSSSQHSSSSSKNHRSSPHGANRGTQKVLRRKAAATASEGASGLWACDSPLLIGSKISSGSSSKGATATRSPGRSEKKRFKPAATNCYSTPPPRRVTADDISCSSSLLAMFSPKDFVASIQYSEQVKKKSRKEASSPHKQERKTPKTTPEKESSPIRKLRSQQKQASSLSKRKTTTFTKAPESASLEQKKKKQPKKLSPPSSRGGRHPRLSDSSSAVPKTKKLGASDPLQGTVCKKKKRIDTTKHSEKAEPSSRVFLNTATVMDSNRASANVLKPRKKREENLKKDGAEDDDSANGPHTPLLEALASDDDDDDDVDDSSVEDVDDDASLRALASPPPLDRHHSPPRLTGSVSSKKGASPAANKKKKSTPLKKMRSVELGTTPATLLPSTRGPPKPGDADYQFQFRDDVDDRGTSRSKPVAASTLQYALRVLQGSAVQTAMSTRGVERVTVDRHAHKIVQAVRERLRTAPAPADCYTRAVDACSERLAETNSKRRAEIDLSTRRLKQLRLQRAQLDEDLQQELQRKEQLKERQIAAEKAHRERTHPLLLALATKTSKSQSDDEDSEAEGGDEEDVDVIYKNFRPAPPGTMGRLIQTMLQQGQQQNENK